MGSIGEEDWQAAWYSSAILRHNCSCIELDKARLRDSGIALRVGHGRAGRNKAQGLFHRADSPHNELLVPARQIHRSADTSQPK